MWQPQIILVVLCFNDGLITRFLQVLVFCFADWEPFCIGLLHYYLWQSLPGISVKQEAKIMGAKNFMSTQIRRWSVHTSLYLVCLGLSPTNTHVSFLLSSTSTGLRIHLVSFSEAIQFTGAYDLLAEFTGAYGLLAATISPPWCLRHK